MRKILGLLLMTSMLLSVMPMEFATSVGTGIGVDVTTEDFPPLVWMCDDRVVEDDATEPGRVSDDDEELVERINNYAFEGESIHWTVLVMDKNKIDQNIDVFATIGDSQGEGNDIEVNCIRIGCQQRLMDQCNAQILEEEITECDDNIMDMFECTLTVETADSMYGEYWVTVEAVDGDGLSGTMDENEYWFFNPVIAVSVDGALAFEDVRPGSQSYSDTILIGNDADDGSGVLLDMFSSGTDFYDSSSSGAKCPDTNQLALTNFRYFVTNGAYSSLIDAGVGRGTRAKDAEGYVGIGYGDGFNDPTPFYDGFEILQAGGPFVGGKGYLANMLAPGAEMALTFKLSLPEPCNGDFDTGSIFFWGEAI